MKYILCLILSMTVWLCYADNLRIHGDVEVVPVSADAVELEVKFSWSNSWRNAYNHDAVYLFGKFSKKDAPAWHHLYLDTATALHTVTEGYSVTVANGGRGILAYPSTPFQGTSVVTLRLKWKIAGNAAHPLTRADIDNKNIQISLHGMEMAYVPSSPFYAGDGQSSGSFSRSDFGILPAAFDIIGANSNYAYSGSGGETGVAFARPADRYNQAAYNASNRHDWNATTMPATWQVDFKTPKTILYFGVSGTLWQEFPPAPAGNWYLEGSADAATWKPLWQGSAEYWGQSATSYPVQQAIRVATPGSYRYYRIRIVDNQCAGLWNNVRIANVAMSETDLSALSETSGVLQDGFRRTLPVNYPLGVNGYYAMKYELTQEQYVTFLNQLPRSGQYTRTIGGLLDGLKEGHYIFGADHSRPVFRNGIILNEQRLNTDAPYVFACNLNPSNTPGNVDDGQTLACNYLSVQDMLAYADWSGLRPLSELEYEKMCRGYYPSLPSGGEYAWESLSVTPATGVVSGGRADESFQNADANVNSGGGIGGPSRVGMFVRNVSRERSGNSFWGFSDLSGNVSEIYLNTGLYGRQFDGRVHGAGDLNINGTHTVSLSSWPGETAAYGVRGGDYSSGASGLSVSNRELATGYFSSLSERRPTVGFRLGYTLEPRRVNAFLTLENGRKSGAVEVNDTVCDASEYAIRGDEPLPGGVCRYLWYRSVDNGEAWQLIEGENTRDLRLSRLTEEVEENVVKKFLYKRIFYSPQSVAESGVVGLVAAHGNRIDRLRDTLQPCMFSPGLEIQTPLPATYEWRCVDNGKLLQASETRELKSHYDVLTSDFWEDAEQPSGLYTLDVKIVLAGRCETHEKLEVEALPYTKNPFPTEGEIITYSKDKHQVVNIWGGQDPQQWTIVNEEKGTLSVADRGMLSGLTTTLCNRITVELVCKDFQDKVYRKEIHEPERTLNYAGAYAPLNLLPGDYRMECWGARGGVSGADYNVNAYGGLGGYASGEISLEATSMFYFYVGGYGGGLGAGPGWNGGGQGGANNDGEPGGSGGGASDVRLVAGNWYSRIIIAGGGGGAANGNTGYGGGGLVGVSSRGGTQAVGYSFGTGGVGGTDRNNYSGGGGGGGGYYGGYAAGTSEGAGGGGSGFVSGLEGCDAVDASGVHTGQPAHYSGIILKNPSMLSSQRDGHGMIKITVR